VMRQVNPWRSVSSQNLGFGLGLMGFRQIYDGLRTSWITLIYDENLRTSREWIRDAQYMTFSNFVINVVLWRNFDDPWRKSTVMDHEIVCSARAARRCSSRLELGSGALDRVRQRAPPPLTAGRRRLSPPAADRPLVRVPGRQIEIRRAWLNPAAPLHLQTPSTVGSRSNGSRSGQTRVNQVNPAGPGNFTENPLSFLLFTDIPFRFRKTFTV
jgi:hypothetical protein